MSNPMTTPITDADMAQKWSCDDKFGACRNSHGCHCYEITTLIARVEELKAKLAKAEETYTDEDGIVWTRPTAWAYYAVCQANEAKRETLATAREALEFVRGLAELAESTPTLHNSNSFGTIKDHAARIYRETE